jgi:hypothetical protein
VATRSPTSYHASWGDFATTALLPNVAGSPTQSATLEHGDTAAIAGSSALYMCVVPTLGAAIWRRQRRFIPCPWNQSDLGVVVPGSGTINGGALATVSTATGLIDGFREQPEDGSIASVIARQVVAGAAGTTGVEIYRYRSAGPWMLIADVALSFAAGDGGSALGIVVAPDIEADDVLVAVVVGLQTGVPRGLTVTVHVE